MTNSSFLNQLGFIRLVSVKSRNNRMTTSQKLIINQVKEFDIDEVHFCEDENKISYPAVFFKKVNSFDISILKKIAKIHHKTWNYKKVMFLYVYNDVEIRIYNCTEKPIVEKKTGMDYNTELRNLELASTSISDKNNLIDLSKVFSASAIDTGIIWTLKEAESIRRKIIIQNRVDKFLVSSLIRTAISLQRSGLKIELIHKIIMRSLFLLYLEDRGATDAKFYTQIKSGSKSYFDILDDVEATYALYKILEDHFNGNVFSIEEKEHINKVQLQQVKRCFISGNDGTDQTQLFEDWRLFNFSIIQIELLSEIYENFLAEIEPDMKKQTGTYYTPPSLVELILNEKLPINNNENKYNVKILDPACGSGIFLVESFNRLVIRYEIKHNKKLSNFKILKQLLLDNIFGIELLSQSIKIAAFSLYLALVDRLDPKTIWQDKNNILPNLINNPTDKSIKVQGKNLFCRDSIDDNIEIEAIEFDLVIGNPPFGTKDLIASERKYCDNYGFAKEKVIPFLHKSIKFSPRGEIALIFNTKLLTNTKDTYKKFRQWMFNDCYVEKIYNFSILRKVPKNYGGQLFGSATGPISIIFFKKNSPKNPVNKIIYYSPKTFVKSNILEGVVIDYTDVKFLQREECQKPDTKIWKISMWGNSQDVLNLWDLSSSFKSLMHFFLSNNIDFGVGFELSEPLNVHNDMINKLTIHTPNNVLRYWTPQTNNRINSNKFRRLGKFDAYLKPHILLNEGVKVNDDNNLSILVSFVDYNSAFTKGIVGIYSNSNDIDLLKIITLYLNSDIVKYFTFLTTSSWGVERDVVKYNEIFEVPYLLYNISIEEKKYLLKKYEEIKYSIINFKDYRLIENEINSIILKKLSSKQRIIINDFIENIELFHKNIKSKSLLPVTSTIKYANMLCKELNFFLNDQLLFTNATIFKINKSSPLILIKISFDKKKREIECSNAELQSELKYIDKNLWEKKGTNIFLRKKLNYKNGKDIYIIRPNQKRYWTLTMAMEDASDLFLEILSED